MGSFYGYRPQRIVPILIQSFEGLYNILLGTFHKDSRPDSIIFPPMYKNHKSLPIQLNINGAKPKPDKIAMKRNKLLQILLFLTIILSFTEATPNITQIRPGCPDKCGNTTIFYPFGTQEGCYMSKDFFVNCTRNGTRAQIHKTSVHLVDISPEGHLKVISPLAYTCYNEKGKPHSHDYPDVALSRFPLSVKQNQITTVGCGTRSNIKTNNIYKGGCPTMPGPCHVINGSCSTIGCCHSVIDRTSVTNFRMRVVSQDGNVGKRGFNNCSYAFIIGEGQYDFSPADFYREQNLKSFQMRLDWTVGNTSCEEAQRDGGTYACQDNSYCYDVNDVKGYRCNCSEGYRGNPYLENGCQDIDECSEGQHDCTDDCQNVNGSYTCSCPKGSYGDGRKTGTRCTKSEGYLQKLGVYSGISMGITITSVTMICIYCGINQRRIVKRRETFFKQNGGIMFQKLLSEFEDSAQFVKIFTEEELKKSTNNFNQNNILGQGGFGTVYKATLSDNTVVAIKKSKVIDKCQIEQFVNEVVILSQINHPNVVRILGCCLETHVPLLVYEFVTNNTLFHHLHGKEYGNYSLTWEMRLKVAVETAEALAHMHSTTQIIHRDVKSSNILLTEDFTSKVSDFGLSRFVPQEKTHVSTAVQGTLGYIDPEYFRSGILTEKSDVYGFGVVLVELLTGEIVHSFDQPESNWGLAVYFVRALENGSLIQVVDDRIMKLGDSEEVKAVAEIAKLCLEMEGKKRPSMKLVSKQLGALRERFSSPDSFTNKSEFLG